MFYKQLHQEFYVPNNLKYVCYSAAQWSRNGVTKKYETSFLHYDTSDTVKNITIS